MNRKYLKVIVYTSVFSVAYGSFFYHRYTSRHSIAAPLSVAEDHISASSSLNALKNIYPDENMPADDINRYNMPDMSASRSEEHTEYKKKTQHDSSFSSPAVYYSGAQRSPDIEQIDYSQKVRYNQDAIRFTAMADSGYTPGKTSTENIEASQNLLSASSKASNDNTITKAVISQDVAESDGSEFLPDGSSQQDLFTSQSKNPRVYTIKNYQTADISCAPGYDDSSPHAKLMRGLKGC